MASSVQADDNRLSLQLISWKPLAGRQPHDGYVLGGPVWPSGAQEAVSHPPHIMAGSVKRWTRALLPTLSTLR